MCCCLWNVCSVPQMFIICTQTIYLKTSVLSNFRFCWGVCVCARVHAQFTHQNYKKVYKKRYSFLFCSTCACSPALKEREWSQLLVYSSKDFFFEDPCIDPYIEYKMFSPTPRLYLLTYLFLAYLLTVKYNLGIFLEQ